MDSRCERIDTRKVLQAGAVLSGFRDIDTGVEVQFEIIYEQGRGASCIVYQAFLLLNGSRDRPVLLKEFYPLSLMDQMRRLPDSCALSLVEEADVPPEARNTLRDIFERQQAQFLETCKKQKAFYLSHVGTPVDELVEIQGLYRLGDSYYVMMRSMGGHSWDQLPRDSLYDVLETTISVLHELELYHDAQLLHSDIKPSNIYIFPKTRQHVVLLDFGSVQRLVDGRLTGAEVLSYSADYAAPELLNTMGKEGVDRQDYYECITKKADLYAAAAVCYSKVTGEPYRQEYDGYGNRWSCGQKLRELWEREKEGWLAGIPVHVMNELADFFDVMLAFNPDDRFSLGEMEGRLRMIINHAEPPKLALSPQCMVDRPVETFVGRTEELEKLKRYLEEGRQTVFIAGDGGVGKSELARRLAWELRDRFVFFRVSFSGSIRETILRLPTQPPFSIHPGMAEESEGRCQWILRCLRGYGGTAVLIIDDFDPPPEQMNENLHSAVFAELMHIQMRVIFTTRSNFSPTEAGVYIRSLPTSELLKLMRGYYKGSGEDEVLMRLIDAGCHNTLIVEQIAKAMEQSWGALTPEKLLTELAGGQTAEEGISKTIRLLFDLSVLDPVSHEIMLQAALFPRDGVQGSTLLQCYDERQRDKLRLLEMSGWVRKESSYAISLHGMVQRLCEEELRSSEADAGEFLRRYAEVFSRLPAEEWMNQRFERVEIMSNAAKLLSDPEGGYAEKAGDLNYQEGLYQQALAHYQDFWRAYLRNHPDPAPLEALSIMNKLASSAYAMNDYSAAIYYETSALQVAEQQLGGPQPQFLPYFVNLGNICREAGRLEDAAECYERAFALEEHFGLEDGLDKAALYMNYAKLCIRIHQDDPARVYVNLAMEIVERCSEISPEWMASLLESNAILSDRAGEYVQELDYATHAIAVYETVLGKEHPRSAVSCNNKAIALIRLGRLREAEACLMEAEARLRGLVQENHNYLLKTRHNLKCLRREMAGNRTGGENFNARHKI